LFSFVHILSKNTLLGSDRHLVWILLYMAEGQSTHHELKRSTHLPTVDLIEKSVHVLGWTLMKHCPKILPFPDSPLLSLYLHTPYGSPMGLLRMIAVASCYNVYSS